MNAITWTPYRGKVEPISKATVAKIEFHKAHLEIKCFYDFEHFYNGQRVDDFVKCHLLLRRDGLELCRSVRVHPDDPDKEEVPILEIYGKNGLAFNVYAETHDIDPIFRELKKWILSS